MSNILTIPANLSINAIVSKKGKISASAQKAADILQGSSASTLLAVALSKGSLSATAQAAVKSLAPTLGEVLTGSNVANWGALLTMLVNQYGMADYNRATMKGRAGTLAYIQLAIDAAYVAVKRAETEKQLEKANNLVTELTFTASQVNRLNDAHEKARMLAEHDAAMLETGLQTAPVAETAPVAAQVAEFSEVF